MGYVLGIDIGTSSCKATLVDAAGSSFTASSDPYAIIAPRPDWAEQDPEAWRHGAAQSIARVCESGHVASRQISAIGLSGQMHSAVLLDSKLGVIRPPLLWCDQRPVAEAASANASMPELRDITLNPLLPAFTLSKMLWIRDHEPEAAARIRHVLLPKDLVRLWLTGSLGTDPSDAAGTGLYDARAWCWSPEVLEHFDIVPDWLPDVKASSDIAGHISPEGMAAFGLPEGTPVVTGGGDQAAQAVGLAALDDRVLALQIGTSGVIVLAVAKPVGGAFCHAIKERWIRLDSLHAAGSSFTWIRDAVAQGEEFSAVLREAAEVDPADGVPVFLPFLTGERAGFGASVPAAFVGLEPQHGRAHLVRAVLEGVAFEMRRMLERWSIEGEGPTEIRVVGGGARHALQLQILADTFGLPVVRLERDSSYGAAVLAGMGLGWWEIAPSPTDLEPIEPDPRCVRGSATTYERYRRLYETMGAR